jgi:hypothetical protein
MKDFANYLAKKGVQKSIALNSFVKQKELSQILKVAAAQY